MLIATDLAPSDTATLNPKQTLALVTAQGGPTSHTAILARTLDLPAVVAAGSAVMDIQDGTTLIVDGDSGTVYLNAGDDDLASARQWQQAQRDKLLQATREAQQPARTRDGQQVEVAANVNRPEQVAAARQAGAEGVGLMRTEFLFLERDSAPDEEEQYQTYRAMLAALEGRPLVIRTLDIGGDKQVPYLNLPHEENPFLGVRGVRLLLRRPDLMLPQLRALYRAAAHGPLSIMFPMVSTLAEVKLLRAQCEQVRAELNAPVVPLGIMVEVPAAATMADRLAEHVDLFLGRHQRPHPVRIGHRPSAPGAGRRSRQPAPGGAAPDRANRGRRPCPRSLGRRVRRHGRRPAGRRHPHRLGRVRAVDEPA